MAPESSAYRVKTKSEKDARDLFALFTLWYTVASLLTAQGISESLFLIHDTFQPGATVHTSQGLLL